MVTNWLMVNSWGTRNFVLSSNGRSFSLWYLSTITYGNTHKDFKELPLMISKILYASLL